MIRRFTLLLACSAALASAQLTVVNGADFDDGRPLAPGGLATAFGDFGISPATPADALSVRIGDQFAQVLGHAEGQVNFEVPRDLTAYRHELVEAPVEVHVHDAVVAQGLMRVRDSSPAIFLADPNHENRPAVALNPNGTLNSEQNPVAAGQELAVYLTGHGAELVSPLPVNPPQSAVNPVVYFGTHAGETVASQLIAPGLWRVRVQVPEIETSGPTPIVVSFDGLYSNTAGVWLE